MNPIVCSFLGMMTLVQPQPSAEQLRTLPQQSGPAVVPPGPVVRPPTAGLPVVTVTKDDTAIAASCRIAIPPGAVIEDANNNGVIQITAPNVVVEFDNGAVLRGSPNGADPDTYAGIGVRIDGQANVTIRGATISGFKVGVWATNAVNFVIEECDGSDNFRQRLLSTPSAEDQSDWLSPHRNDNNEHLTNYGAAFYIEDSHHVTVRKCLVRHGQNSLFLDRVNDSRVFDNEFSFSSGWGIFLYRSSRNTVSRNACDFNIRGYSHGVYNRGQDSAGILLFEQSSNNVIADNSATHCGDGVFAFAGIEALGEDWFRAEQRRGGTGSAAGEPIKIPADVLAKSKRAGCNDNIFVKNDLSFAAAHGLELTFSFGNTVVSNLIRYNGICGVWAGYSQDSLIGGNNFTSNGVPGTRADGSGEGGGINIEHGSGNRLIGNKFIANPVAIKLWSDNDGDLLKFPWAAANYKGSSGNILKMNMFDGDSLGIRYIATTGTRTSINSFKNVPADKQVSKDEGCDVTEEPMKVSDSFQNPTVKLYGDSKPFNSRPALHGRENIVMTEWGPWDHTSPIVRPGRTPSVPGAASHEFFGLPSRLLQATVLQGDVVVAFEEGKVNPNVLIVSPRAGGAKGASGGAAGGASGVMPYRVKVTSGDYTTEVTGMLMSASWKVNFFQTPDYGAKNAPPSLEEWRALAAGADAKTVTTNAVSFRFASGGPGELGLAPDAATWGIKPDHFGTIATTTIPMPKGTYRMKTLSDDGVRVTVNDQTLIERWNWHAPEADEVEFVLEEAQDVTFVVEHFEIDGFAVLEFAVEPVEAE